MQLGEPESLAYEPEGHGSHEEASSFEVSPGSHFFGSFDQPSAHEKGRGRWRRTRHPREGLGSLEASGCDWAATTSSDNRGARARDGQRVRIKLALYFLLQGHVSFPMTDYSAELTLPLVACMRYVAANPLAPDDG